jgi:hypothetical protein
MRSVDAPVGASVDASVDAPSWYVQWLKRYIILAAAPRHPQATGKRLDN